ncbi:MAG: Asp23/Gls24 family envelope stress response protein [Bacilli bacterium]|nr:Asp23/Gls24 family envelope stress response protein [Bacilli bacterium]
MKKENNPKYGEVKITLDAIASVAGEAAAMCYGVVGLAPRPSFVDILPEQIQKGLKKEDYSKGIYAIKTPKGFDVSLYLYVAYGVKLTEVLSEVQKRVKYVLENTFQMQFDSVNVYVMDVKDAE